METKKTSLFNLHKKNGAKFVEFAGYQMPIQYKDGVIQEHKYTRSKSGVFDVSHMGQLFIYDAERLTESLEKVFPVDLKNLNINQNLKTHFENSYDLYVITTTHTIYNKQKTIDSLLKLDKKIIVDTVGLLSNSNIDLLMAKHKIFVIGRGDL